MSASVQNNHNQALNNQAPVNNDAADQAVDAKKTKRSLKKNVAPAEFNGPSRPPTGFMLYSSANRDAVTAALKAALKPDEKFQIKTVASKLGEQWRLLSEADKATFNKQGEELKAKYEVDLEKWKSTNDYKQFVKASALHNKKKADKKAVEKAKADGMPQRPMAGYMRFANAVRDTVRKELDAKGEKFSLQAGAGLTKAKWVALGEEGQKKYHEEYQVAKAKYDEELKAWQESEAGKTFSKTKATNAKRKAKNSKVPKAKKAKGNDGEAVEDEAEESDVESSVEEDAAEE